jgi:hypothetical protein
MLPVLPLWIPVAAAIAGLVAFTRSESRDHAPSREAADPRATRSSRVSGAPVPSALEVFNAFLREGRPPPHEIAELAAGEARAAGIDDLAADIERTFLSTAHGHSAALRGQGNPGLASGLPSTAGPTGDTRVAQTSSAPLGAPLGGRVSVGKAVPTDAALIGLPAAALGDAAAPTPGGGGLPSDLMSAITGQSAQAQKKIESKIGDGYGYGNGNGVGDSPIPGMSATQWDALRTVLAREPSSYDSGRHIGRYRQSKQRLAELGIDPAAIARNPDAQDKALEVDLADAYRHLAASRVLDRALGRPIVIPDMDEAPIVTLPGLLGVCAAAGLDHCASWLRSKADRVRFRHTTNLFLRCNAVGGAP